MRDSTSILLVQNCAVSGLSRTGRFSCGPPLALLTPITPRSGVRILISNKVIVPYSIEHDTITLAYLYEFARTHFATKYQK